MIAIIIFTVLINLFILSALGKMEQYKNVEKTLWQEVDGVKILGPHAIGDGFMIRLA